MYKIEAKIEEARMKALIGSQKRKQLRLEYLLAEEWRESQSRMKEEER